MRLNVKQKKCNIVRYYFVVLLITCKLYAPNTVIHTQHLVVLDNLHELEDKPFDALCVFH